MVLVRVPEPVLVLEVVVVVVLVGSGSGVRANHAKNKGTEHRANLAQLHPTMQPSCVADHQVHQSFTHQLPLPAFTSHPPTGVRSLTWSQIFAAKKQEVYFAIV